MTIINTGLTEPGIRSEFFDAFGQMQTVWQDLASVIKSNKKEEDFAWLGALPPMREWGTGRKVDGVITETYSAKSRKYESTLEVDRDEVSDDQTGQIMQRVRQMGERAATHKDALLAALLASGHVAGYNSYDGVPFFSANHESNKSGTQSNIVTPSASDADAPTAAEFRTALSAGITRLMQLKDDQGEPMSETVTGLVCVVPPNMYLTANEALLATLTGGAANVLANAAKVVSFARLTDTSKFFMAKTDVSVRPFILLDREALEFKSVAENSEEEFMRDKYYYGVRARYHMTYGFWQRCLSLDFTAS